MKKRILGIVLCLVMALSLVPAMVFAANPTLDDLKFTLNPNTDIVFLTNEAAHDGIKIYVKNTSSENISYVAGCGESDFVADGSFIGTYQQMLTPGQETYFTVKLKPTKNDFASGTVSIDLWITNYPGIKKTVTIPVKYDSNVAFTTQPVSGSAGLGEEYIFQWATSPALSTCMLQKQVGSGFINEKTIKSTTATVPARSFETTSTYRLMVAFDGVYSYSNEFTVTWEDKTDKQFTTQPVGGTVKNGEQYPVTWAMNFEPDYVYVEWYHNDMWIHVQPANATGATLPDLASNGSAKLRVAAYKDGVAYYSNEFTVTWGEAAVDPAISRITITGIDEPVVGQHPDFTYSIANANDLGITGSIRWVKYVNGLGTNMTADDVFEAGSRYGCYIDINAIGDGYFRYTTEKDEYDEEYNVFYGTFSINGTSQEAYVSVGAKALSATWWGKEAKSAVMPGDVNGDMSVNNADLTALLRHVAKIELLNDTSCADINKDGNIDAADVTALAKKIQG